MFLVFFCGFMGIGSFGGGGGGGGGEFNICRVLKLTHAINPYPANVENMVSS